MDFLTSKIKPMYFKYLTAALAVVSPIWNIIYSLGLLMGIGGSVLFGAEETLLPLARSYVLPVKFVVPSFLFTQLMAAFLRNDSNPGLATKSVIFGGIFNVFGDYFFVFVLNMGIMGAG